MSENKDKECQTEKEGCCSESKGCGCGSGCGGGKILGAVVLLVLGGVLGYLLASVGIMKHCAMKMSQPCPMMSSQVPAVPQK